MLLISVTIGSTTLKVSDDILNLESQYLPLVKTFDPPQRSMNSLSGGWSRMSYGAIEFSPDLFSSDWPAFTSATSALWPPPETVGINVKHTETTESEAVELFTGTGYLTTVNRELVNYDLYAEDIDAPLLEETLGYDGELYAIPQAFGEVHHENLIRLSDYGDYPRYHLSGVSGTRARAITALYDDGLGFCIVECSLHGFSQGDIVGIEGCGDSSNGWWTVTSVIDEFTFVCDAPYTETGAGQAYKPGYWRVFDNGVPFSGNAISLGDGTIYLTSEPEGNVTISGTGTGASLDDVVSWACTRLSLTYNSDYANPVSPQVCHWASSQRTTLEFLDELCATFTHMFWISGSTLYLIDMGTPTSTTAISEYEFFNASYERQPPASVLSTTVTDKWVVTSDTGAYVNERNYVVSVVSKYKYGEAVDITAFNWKKQKARDSLRRVMGYHYKQRIAVAIPINSSIPTPGTKITFSDSSLKATTDSFVFVRSISYDFYENKCYIEGDGSLGEEAYYEIPTGLIIAFLGDNQPTGWSWYGGDSIGRFLVGAGDSIDPEEIGGTDGVLGASSSDGTHTGTSLSNWLRTDGSDLEYSVSGAPTATEPNHSHEIFIEYLPKYQNMKLLQAQYPTSTLPTYSVLFSKSNTAPTSMSESVKLELYLRSGEDLDSANAATGDVVVSTSGAHAHGAQGQYAATGAYTNNYRYEEHQGHTHTISGTFSIAIKSAYVRAWTALSDIDFPDDSVIAMYDSLDIPAGWALCDGTGGTPDLTDCFIVLSADGTTANDGDNTATVDYTLSTGGHTHLGTTVSGSYDKLAGYHSNTITHSHTLDDTIDYFPKFFGIVFIMYVGV